jgi:glycosyltransferase involved in cell wall biosynthesis
MAEAQHTPSIAQSIALIMIVKNEEHVIERSLNSILPFVDSWCIVDTGSTDTTMQKIRTTAEKHGKPGTLHQRPWVNFGHNRTELLELARAEPHTWFFMLDADDIVESKAPFKHLLNPIFDTYHVELRRGTLVYKRPVIFNKKPWVFKGALHEYAELPNARHSQLENIFIDARVEGSRSQNPNKYRDDALALEEEFKKHPDPRTAFYCAQSWRDCGNIEKATEWYLTRTKLTGWNQETYVSYLNLIRLTSNIDDKFKYAWAALEISPRLEATHSVLETLRQRGLWSKQAYSLALATAEGAKAAKAGDIANYLFTEPQITPKFYDEVCIHSYYTGNDETAIFYGMKAYVLGSPQEQQRLLDNVKFSANRV